MSEHDLIALDNLFAYFHDRVTQARLDQGTEVDEHTEFYLVNLLVEFLRTSHLSVSGGRRVDELPLTIRLLEAGQATPAERYRELKHLGDTTLYVLGWFAESLERSLVDRSYYEDLGGSAYRRLSRLVRGMRGDQKDPIFRELASKFRDCVGLVTNVREQTYGDSSDIVQLYDAWRRTGSERAFRRLQELGVIPSASTDPRKPTIVH